MMSPLGFSTMKAKLTFSSNCPNPTFIRFSCGGGIGVGVGMGVAVGRGVGVGAAVGGGVAVGGIGGGVAVG